MLGNPGSNPLELFWDTVDALDQQLDEKIAVVEGAIARHNATLGPSEDKPAADGTSQGEEGARGFVVGPETTQEEFKSIVKTNADDAVSALRREDLHVIYRTVSRPRSGNIF